MKDGKGTTVHLYSFGCFCLVRMAFQRNKTKITLLHAFECGVWNLLGGCPEWWFVADFKSIFKCMTDVFSDKSDVLAGEKISSPWAGQRMVFMREPTNVKTQFDSYLAFKVACFLSQKSSPMQTYGKGWWKATHLQRSFVRVDWLTAEYIEMTWTGCCSQRNWCPLHHLGCAWVPSGVWTSVVWISVEFFWGHLSLE